MGTIVEQYDNDHLILGATVDKRLLDAQADQCAALRAAGAGNGKDEKLAMSVDGWVINDWCVKKGIAWAEFMRNQRLQTQFIEDPDNAAFRIWTGKL